MEIQDFTPERTLCFTGHRPEKLPKGRQLSLVIDALHRGIDAAVQKGYVCFLTGMADGVDYYAAEYVMQLQETCPHLFLVGVQPCVDYESFFRSRRYDLNHLYTMQTGVDQHIILPGNSRERHVFLRRNDWMLDHSRAVIGVCSSMASGSGYTLRRGMERGYGIYHIAPAMQDMYDARPEVRQNTL